MPDLVDQMLQTARQDTGLQDLGDEWFLGPLQAYAADLQLPHLSEWGRAFLARLAHKDLVRRLQVIDCLKKNPEIEETALPPIAYITGHERSGTTLLHNLLSLHEKARYLSRWELMMPTPPPQASTFGSDERQALVQKSVDALRGSDLEKMHWVNADEPDECPWGFIDCTGLLGMAPSLIMPNWFHWLYSHDMTQTFVNYRKIVQILTWKNPVPDGGFLVLKAPQMASYLPSFSAVFPEAHFIYIHRDPYRVMTSFSTLIDVVDGPFLEDRGYLAELERTESMMLSRMGRLFDSLVEFEQSQPHKVSNIHYSTLLEHPATEINRLFGELNYPQDTALDAKVSDFLARQKAGGRAKARQQLDESGYSREAVDTYPPIANYLSRYRVAIEATRQTGE